jgi:hypothetical protein
LESVACGLHLDRGYRLAFTLQSALVADERPRVVLLYVGRRQPKHRQGVQDVWDQFHDLFEVGNPPADHHKPPCCGSELPEIDHKELDEFLRRLKRFNRGR